MKSPSTIDQELVKEYKVGKEAELEDMFKLSYVRSQLDEMKKALFRYRVDAILSDCLIEQAKKDDKPEMESKFRENLSNNKVLVRQFAQSISIMEQFKNELEAAIETSSSTAQ